MRKIASMTAAVLLVGGLLAGVVRAQGGIRSPARSGGFAKPSSPIEFYRSEKGREFLSRSSKPAARSILKAFGGDASGLPQPSGVEPRTSASQGQASPADAGTVSSSCGTSHGTKFNLEPTVDAFPQNEQAVDFKRNGVGSGVDLVVGASNEFGPRIPISLTGYYVNRDGDCAPEFEGGTPPIADPVETGDLLGGGDPVVAADPVRNAFFVADIHFDDTTTAIGVFRSTTATLLSTGSCPSGTHDEADSLTCWPTREAVLARLFTADPFDLDIVDKPHLAVDEHPSHTGAGQVYIVATDFSATGSQIKLVACSSDLQTCSAPQIVSGADADTQFPHVTVRPSGALGITWINYVPGSGPSPDVAIRYQSCTVATVPTAPSCPPSLFSTVHTETEPLLGTGALLGEAFRVDTYPKVDVRRDSNGIEMYVVWDRCKVDLIEDFVCPDSDIVMKASNNNGGSWSGVTSVHTGSNHQFHPWIRTDRSRNIVNIIYLTSLSDTTFQHRVRVGLQHINPGGSTPDPITDGHTMASLLNDPSGDWLFGGVFPFYGDYIGVAARGTGSDGGSRAYGHFTYNNLQGTYSGVSAPNQNNHLSRLDY